MANDVCTSTGLDSTELTGKLVQVAVEHGSDASFLLCSLMWKAVQEGASLCLLALHNNKTHYHNVGKRLGLDLRSAVILEPFRMYAEESGDFAGLDMSDDANMKRLFLDVKRSLDELSAPKCLVVDDLCDLLSLGGSVQQVLVFLRHCRLLVDLDSSTSLVVGTHRSQDRNLVATATAHMADCRLSVAPLRTGFSSEVTGTVQVDSRLFHYKLTDRQVRVFAPGSAGLHS